MCNGLHCCTRGRTDRQTDKTDTPVYEECRIALAEFVQALYNTKQDDIRHIKYSRDGRKERKKRREKDRKSKRKKQEKYLS
jgi:hypothetical protein